MDNVASFLECCVITLHCFVMCIECSKCLCIFCNKEPPVSSESRVPRSQYVTNHDNNGPLFSPNIPSATPHSIPNMPSAPPFDNLNPTGTEVFTSQPQRSNNFNSNNDQTATNSKTPSTNDHLAPPPEYSSLFPEKSDSKH